MGTGNAGRGRPKGSPNKVTKDIKSVIHAHLNDYLPELLSEVQGAKLTHGKLQFYMALIALIVPRPTENYTLDLRDMSPQTLLELIRNSYNKEHEQL